MMPKAARLAPFILAAAAAIPGISIHLAGIHLQPHVQAIVSGAAIMGAAFILLWASEAAQRDVSQALALAVIALIAVLPEYAVDAYFTWQAGKYPESDYAHYAIANMTGANRLLIGLGWAVIVLIAYIRSRKAVTVQPERRSEILFLALATIYAMVVVLKGSLTLIDSVIFLGLYAWYVRIASGHPCDHCVIEGPAQVVADLPKVRRRIWVALLFIFSAGAILANAERFSEGLVDTGKMLHINEFLLVQWLAPIASEMPEFVVAVMFTLRNQANLALGSLISSKLNQWTLLVGMIPIVYAISAGNVTSHIPLGSFQMGEIYLTAAQSVFAVVMVASLRLSPANAILLFVLFVGQLVSPEVAQLMPNKSFFGLHSENMHRVFTWAYLILSVVYFLRAPKNILDLRLGLRK